MVGLALGLSRGQESLAEIGIRSPRVGATPQRINLACLVVLTHPKHHCTELPVLQLPNAGAQQTHRRMTGKELTTRAQQTHRRKTSNSTQTPELSHGRKTGDSSPIPELGHKRKTGNLAHAPHASSFPITGCFLHGSLGPIPGKKLRFCIVHVCWV